MNSHNQEDELGKIKLFALLFKKNFPMECWVSQVAQMVKNLLASAGDAGDSSSVFGSGRSPREENGNPLQYSFLENSRDRRAWPNVMVGKVSPEGQIQL